MKKIVVITTGGTISMKKVGDELGTYQQNTFQDDLYALFPQLKELVALEIHDFMNVGSGEIRYEHIIRIRNLIHSYAEKGFDGAVITHGTDTMEQSSYLLDLITDVKMGIAFTGSQKLASDPSYDGYQNMMDAIIAVSDEDAYKQGVLLVFNGTIFFAREVTKTHATSLDTFQSPTYGCAGIIGDDYKTYWYKDNKFREFYPVDAITCRVEIVRQYINGDDFILRYLRESKVDGIVLEGLGAGSILPDAVSEAYRCVNDGIAVVVTSMCAGRFLSNTYADDYCANGLNAHGLIMGDHLSAIKARIKLAVLLSTTDKAVNIKTAFHKNFYQTMPIL